MIMQRAIFHPFPIFTSELDALFLSSRGHWFAALNVDASGHAVQGMKKHVKFRGPAQSSAVVCSVVTASRCEVAKHAATLVFDCEVFPRCESIGRHARVVETPQHFLGSQRCSLRERHCYCPCDAGGHRILFSHLFSVLVFSLYAWLCFRCSVVDVCFCACSDHLFHSAQTHIASSVGSLTKLQDSVNQNSTHSSWVISAISSKRQECHPADRHLLHPFIKRQW